VEAFALYSALVALDEQRSVQEKGRIDGPKPAAPSRPNRAGFVGGKDPWAALDAIQQAAVQRPRARITIAIAQTVVAREALEEDTQRNFQDSAGIGRPQHQKQTRRPRISRGQRERIQSTRSTAPVSPAARSARATFLLAYGRDASMLGTLMAMQAVGVKSSKPQRPSDRLYGVAIIV
jgi:hypothetical protein